MLRVIQLQGALRLSVLGGGDEMRWLVESGGHGEDGSVLELVHGVRQSHKDHTCATSQAAGHPDPRTVVRLHVIELRRNSDQVR
jgi:hypothetical protein